MIAKQEQFRLNDKSRMCGHVQVRFYEGERGKFLLSTRPIIHCKTQNVGIMVMKALERRLNECGLQMHGEKTKLVYCKDSNRKGNYPNVAFDFLGYTFKPRMARNSQRGEIFTNWLPAISNKAMKSMNEKMRSWEVLKKTTNTIQEIAEAINPVLRGWITYYGKFYKTKLRHYMHIVNIKLARWARRKYKKLRTSEMKAIRWLHQLCVRRPHLFAHWSLLNAKPSVGKSERHNGRLLRAVLTESQAEMPGFTY